MEPGARLSGGGGVVSVFCVRHRGVATEDLLDKNGYGVAIAWTVFTCDELCLGIDEARELGQRLIRWADMGTLRLEGEE